MPQITYIYRPLLNVEDIQQWANQQEIKNPSPDEDLHVTIAHSRKAIDLDKAPLRKRELVILSPICTIGIFGAKRAIAVKFKSPGLQDRFKELRAAGASWDYPEYILHITVGFGENSIKSPYRGQFIFGPEVLEKWEV